MEPSEHLIREITRIADALEAHRDLAKQSLDYLNEDLTYRRELFAKATEEKKAEKEQFAQLATLFNPAGITKAMSTIVPDHPALSDVEIPARPPRIPRTRRPHTNEEQHQ